jgi:transcriptional regulator with XRE-family HTH domain
MAKAKKEKKPLPTNTFGSRVRAIRKSLKMIQEKFVTGLEISTTHLSEIELDKSKPGLDFFSNIIKNYHVNPYYLFFGEGEMFAGAGEEIVTDVKKMKTGDKNIDEFLYYFFNSTMVHSYLMYHFRRLLNDEKPGIMKDMASSPGEEKST